MNKDEVTKKFGDQVVRALAVERIKGYEFPDKCDVGVLVLSYTADAYRVKVRIDHLSIEATITLSREAKDIAQAVDHLIEPWLVTNATKKP